MQQLQFKGMLHARNRFTGIYSRPVKDLKREREKALLLALKICNDSFTGASVLNSASSKHWSAKGNNQITLALVTIDIWIAKNLIYMNLFICLPQLELKKQGGLSAFEIISAAKAAPDRNAKGLFRHNATMAPLLSEPIISNGLHGTTIAYCLAKHSSVWAVSTGHQCRPVPKVSEHKIILSCKFTATIMKSYLKRAFSCISWAVLSKHKNHSYIFPFHNPGSDHP